VKGVEPLIELLETKNALLIELLKRIRVDEADCRQDMDLLSQQADRAKKTVATATALALSPIKQGKQKDNLGQVITFVALSANSKDRSLMYCGGIDSGFA
jgi:hypothetical protein